MIVAVNGIFMVKSICLVTHDFAGLIVNGGIGSYYNEIAKLLHDNGWNVIILYYSFNGKIDDFAKKYYNKYGIPIFDAIELCKESDHEKLDEIYMNTYIFFACSHIYHEALQVLMNKYGQKFDLIEFPDWQADAFVPVNMKKNFNLYEQTKIIVKLHSPSEWAFNGMGKLNWTENDVQIFHMEKYAFENADIQVSPSVHLLDWCRNQGWKVKPDASICRNPMSLPINCESVAHKFNFTNFELSQIPARKEIIFFGRFEERKGIKEFIDAIRHLNNILPNFSGEFEITFVGKSSTFTKEQIQDKLPGFKCKFFTFSRRDEAIKYLVDNARLVVLPSKLDNFPNTVIECMLAKIPFITSRTGGIPEILGVESKLYSAISYDISNKDNLSTLIGNYLEYTNDYINELINSGYKRVTEVTNPIDILKWYDEKLLENLVSSNVSSNPGVTIIIPTMNYTTKKYLETTIKSLLDQTYKNISILVKDSSTDPKALMVFNYLKDKYRNILFIQKSDTSIGNALNQSLPYVNTKYLIEVDADNIAKPKMVEIFVKAMENRNDIAALSSYNTFFQDEDEEEILKLIKHEKADFHSNYFYKPIGICLPLLFFQNTQGDANSIFRTDVLKSIGGWPEESCNCQDWRIWIKLLAYGYEVDVIRESLYYYRNRPDADSKMLSLYDVDNANVDYIKLLIEKRPEFYVKYCYNGLHRLRLAGQAEGAAQAEQEFNAIKHRLKLEVQAAGAAQVEQELNVIKQSALFSVGVKLGNIAEKHPIIKNAFNRSGNIVKRTIGTLNIR